MNSSLFCLDATPLDSGHIYRGVGAYVSGLITALEQCGPNLPLLKLRFSRRLRDHHKRTGSEFFVFRPSERSRLHWLYQTFLLSQDVRSTEAAWYHATDFRGIPIHQRFKTLATAYDLVPLRFPHEYLETKPLDIRLAFRSMTKRYQQAEHLVAISQATKRDFVEYLQIDPSRISVIPLGFDDALFKPSVLEEQLRIKTGDKYFLYIGAQDFRKNIRFMLASFARIQHQVKEKFVFAGKQDARTKEQFQRWVKELGLERRVVDLDFVPLEWLPGLYSSATAFVFCSLYEGFGLPMLEAMGCGCPVLASNTSSIPEVVGDAGICVDPTDEIVTSERMVELAISQNPRNELIAKGFERAQLFSWRRCATSTLNLYHKLANGSTFDDEQKNSI